MFKDRRIFVLEKATGTIGRVEFQYVVRLEMIIGMFPKGEDDKVCLGMQCDDDTIRYHEKFREFLKKKLPENGYELLENTDERISYELLLADPQIT